MSDPSQSHIPMGQGPKITRSNYPLVQNILNVCSNMSIPTYTSRSLSRLNKSIVQVVEVRLYSFYVLPFGGSCLSFSMRDHVLSMTTSLLTSSCALWTGCPCGI